MPGESLGKRIRELREQRNLTYEQLHSRTKILIKYLKAIEDGRWDLLPEHVYLRPFIKNIAEALEVNFNELYSLVEHAQPQPEIEADEEPSEKRFDYRWVVVAILMLSVLAVIYFLKPSGKNEEHLISENPEVLTNGNHMHIQKEKRFSSKLDNLQNFVNIDNYHIIELSAADSVWIILKAGSDTLYVGVLSPGRKIKRRSAQPFTLVMGRSNCLNVTYDNKQIDGEKYLYNKRRINFSEIDLSVAKKSGDPNEN
ncbi:MAG: DUF4115 domain-containing protein [candidate division Zixibacteria bacterium]|nr:DUF4115 domain-containing protein [candidate division Zixibacteria bacterium]